MALILAVDPGWSQAAAMERLGRELHGHELVSTESCAEAITTLERRVPDVVLLPPLLPEADEAQLRSRLHAISDNVCILSIPLLAAEAPPAAKPSRWFGRFGRAAERVSPEACDPRVFASQILEYLAAAPQVEEPFEEVMPPRLELPAGPASLTPPQMAAPIPPPAAEEPAALPSDAGLPPEIDDADRRARVAQAAAAAASWIRARRGTSSQADPTIDVARPPQAAAGAPVHTPPRPAAPPPVLPPPAAAAPVPMAPRPVAPLEPPPPAPAPAPEPPRTPTAASVDPAPSSFSRWDGPITVDAIGELSESQAPVEGPPVQRQVFAGTTVRPEVARFTRRWVPLGLIVGVTVAAGYAYWPNLVSSVVDGTVVLESEPPGSEIVIDGVPAGTTPLTADVRAGRHTVEFRNGDAAKTFEVVVSARGRVVQTHDWTAPLTGTLQVMSEPAGARVLVDGEERGTTPLTLTDVTAGRHDVLLQSQAGEVRRSVTVSEDQTTELSEVIFTGFVTVFAPFEVQVFEGNRALRLDERGQMMLPPGVHELRFQNREFGYQEVRRVNVDSAGTTRLSLVPPTTTVSVTANEPAEVFVDGKRLGDTPVAGASIDRGTREIVVRSATAGERRFFLKAAAQPIELAVDFSQPQR